MAVTVFAACALNPPMLPAMADPIRFLAMLSSTRAVTVVLRVDVTMLAGTMASHTTDLPRPSSLYNVHIIFTVMWCNFGWFQPHVTRVACNISGVERNTRIYKTVRLRMKLGGRLLYWNSQKLLSILEFGAGICTVLTVEAVATGEVNKLVRLG